MQPCSNRRKANFIHGFLLLWDSLSLYCPEVDATSCRTLDLTGRAESSSDVPFFSVRRRAILASRTDRTVTTFEGQSKFYFISGHPRTCFSQHAACGVVADNPPNTGAYSRESGRLTTAFEAALSGIEPERWYQVTREMCPIRVDISDNRNPRQMMEAFRSGQAALNMMPRPALTRCIGGFISLASTYVRKIEECVRVSGNNYGMDLFKQDTSSLIDLVLGQPMVFLVTWKTKSSSVAEIWVSAAHTFAVYAVSTENESLSRIVTAAFHQAQQFAAHWSTCTELQYKVVSFMSYAIAAIEGIRDEAKKKPAATMRWLSIVEIMHSNDVRLVVTVRALCRMMKLAFLDDADDGIISRTAHDQCVQMQTASAVARAAVLLRSHVKDPTRTQIAHPVEFRPGTLTRDCSLQIYDFDTQSEAKRGGLVSQLTDGLCCSRPPTGSQYDAPD